MDKTPTDWTVTIATLMGIKSNISDEDPLGLWPYHLPRIAATESDLVAVERALDVALDERHRAFLRFVDGWVGFHQQIQLFGTPDILQSLPAYAEAFELLQSVEAEVLQAAGLADGRLVLVAAGARTIDLVVMLERNGLVQPAVHWLAGEEVERWETFDDFVLGMVEHNRRELQCIRSGYEPYGTNGPMPLV